MSQFFSHESHLNFQQHQRNSNTIVPLVKFSYSLTRQGSATGSKWTHYSRNDLELVVQEVQVGSPRFQNESQSHLVMKVVAGAEYLEEQDLEVIAGISKNFIPSPGIEVPVRVVVKPPLLALRYPKLHNVCRLQFRFRDNSGFSQIIGILTSLGLAITENVPSGPFLQCRPPTANSTSSGISMISSIPTTSYLTPSQNTEFKVPMRPDSASSTLQNSSSSYTPQFNNHSVSRPQYTVSISSFVPQSKPSAEPFKRAQSLYVSQLEREPQIIQTSNFVAPSPNSIPLSHDTNENRALLQKLEDSQRRFSAFPFYKPQAGDRLSSGSILSSPVNSTSNHKGHEHGTVPDSSGSLEIRPLSRPTDYSTFSALGRRPISLPTEHDICSGLSIPPKRHLPFSTAKVSLNLASITPENANTTVQTANKRKRPVGDTSDIKAAPDVSTSIQRQVKRRVASGKNITHLPETTHSLSRTLPSKILTGDGLGISVQDKESSSLMAKSCVMSDASGVPSKLQSKKVVARQLDVSTLSDSPETLKMVNRSTQTQEILGRDHTASSTPTQSASALQPSSKTSTAFGTPPVLQNDLDLFSSRYSSRSKISLPPNYSDVSDDVRLEMLNDFIIANLENEDFLKLAEDMDASWRRLGLNGR
ncbi:hypothetical protein DID88_007828 [Monilinia fructigena]|uniref:Uncharacterized protein n=1 Tax=Monilinia fructigena TaxID=38457 RepID=A0A395J4H2_9HELO|nr:hypothetical protein DID88_007828 [Monilinia fructigena]